jgi:CRP/FNR family transcriptional regulator, cyclic AMP receptor protein
LQALERCHTMATEGDSRGSARWPETTLLGRLSDRARRDFFALGTNVQFPNGRTILRQGELGHVAYLLLRGCVKVRGNEGEWEPLLAVRIGGDLIGEMSILAGKPRSATILTCAPTTAIAIPARDLRAFLLRCPEVTLEIASILAERLRWANERRVDIAALDPRARLARVLITLAETYGRPVHGGLDLGAPLTQAELAALAGIRLPTAEKALRAFADLGLVRLGYRTIAILNLEALRELPSP